MMFNRTNRTRHAIGVLLAVGVIGAGAAGAAGAVAASQSAAAQPHATVRAAASQSTVPKSLTRAETAAEDVIGSLESGRPARAKREARILRDLARGAAAGELRKAGVSPPQIAAFQQRAERTARLSLAAAPALQVAQAANSVSQLMPGFYARYHDPVPVTVLELDYLDRQAQLDAKAGDRANLQATLLKLDASWRQLRGELVRAGGTKVARLYDQHVSALKRSGTATATQQEAVHGLAIVDQMEGVFLGR